MKRFLLTATLAVAALAPVAAFACEGDCAKHQAAALKSVTVTELASMTREKKAIAVDANGEKTRQAEGVIPGAILLTSSSQYALKELPADKTQKLVFYCANTKCGASHAAAEKAREAGYHDVAVMPDGIVGWKKAGQPTAKPNS